LSLPELRIYSKFKKNGLGNSNGMLGVFLG